MSQTSEPVTTSLHKAPVHTSMHSAPMNTSLHSASISSRTERMGKPHRRTRLSAARPKESSTSGVSSSLSQAEHLPHDHIQAQTQNISKDRMLTKSQSQPSNTRVLHSSNHANLPSIMSPVACVSTSAIKTTRSPVLAKRVYKRKTGCDAVDTRQRRHDEGLGNIDLKSASRRVFQERKRKNQASSSKPKNGNSANSVNVNQTARSSAARVSTFADNPDRLAYYYGSVVVKQVQARHEASRMARELGNQKLLQESDNWNLNWSCSLMTHDTDVTPRDWLYFK